MDEYLHMDSQVGSSLISDLSSFISKVGEGDLTNKFTTNEIFRSREHLLYRVRGMTYDLGFVVVIVRSDIATSVRERKTFIILRCERGGKYQKYKADAVPSVYDTRKCECLFRLKGKPCSNGDGWVLKVMCEHHNHELAETLVGHPYAGRDKYIHWSRCSDDSEVVTDLFWTHPDAVKLLNSFNVVFLMDSTYKTNRNRLPLLEIVGMTSIGLNFSTTFSFLSTKLESNFTWALEKMKGLFLTSEGGPKVIVTDRDLALMNAIANVFPESYKMLCQFHILKNVKAKYKMLVNSNEVWDVLMDAWQNVMDCADESLFAEYVNDFQYASSSWVESAHWSLKKVLGNNMGDLCSCWDIIHNVVILQHNKIKASFERSLLLTSDPFKGYRYRKLIGSISRYALDLIAKELERVQ
ncbi:uncharacterized protein LOC124834478 [Vigna umbellata]|uniref:uncharacterized protein LOC124834478 n=1 Tax=Vigna umbellata TaxID=87088 RepID=UPI001F5F1A07|nr:uncharacterized protein LOC124834478 [Vigna umbellata]